MELTLKQPSQAFLAVARLWHDDEDLNKSMLFGPGEIGKRKAKASLDLFDDDVFRQCHGCQAPILYLLNIDLFI